MCEYYQDNIYNKNRYQYYCGSGDFPSILLILNKWGLLSRESNFIITKYVKREDV